MRALTRKSTESIQIADNVVVRVLGVCGNRVRFGIEAPSEIAIHRTELLESRTIRAVGDRAVQVPASELLGA
jgi:carbon storage regulator